MGLTLRPQESLKLTNYELQAGVIGILEEESKILRALPFMEIEGSGYTYTVQGEVPKPKFRSVGESYEASTTKLNSEVVALTILGDEAIVDTYQQQVQGSINDLMAVEVSLKAKGIAHAYEKTFISGDTNKDPKSFNGLAKLVDEKQIVKGSGVLADDIDNAIDMIKGTPSIIIMSKTVRRKFVQKYRGLITKNRGDFGAKLLEYGGCQIIDLDEEVMGEEKDSVFVLRVGENEAVCGIHNGGIMVTPLGQSRRSPQIKTRLEWFTGLAVFDKKTLAKIEIVPEV